MFGAIGPGLWNNGAACGKKYAMKCLSPAGGTGKCTGNAVVVTIVDGRLGNRAPTFSLTPEAAKQLYTGGGTFEVTFQEA